MVGYRGYCKNTYLPQVAMVAVLSIHLLQSMNFHNWNSWFLCILNKQYWKSYYLIPAAVIVKVFSSTIEYLSLNVANKMQFDDVAIIATAAAAAT